MRSQSIFFSNPIMMFHRPGQQQQQQQQRRPRRCFHNNNIWLIPIIHCLFLLLILLSSSSSSFYSVSALLEFQSLEDNDDDYDDARNQNHKNPSNSNNNNNNDDDDDIDDDDDGEWISLHNILENTHTVMIQVNQSTTTTTTTATTTTGSSHHHNDDENNNKNSKLRNVSLVIPLPCSYPLLPNHDNCNNNNSSNNTNHQPNPSVFYYYVQESTSSLMAAKTFAKTVLKKRRRKRKGKMDTVKSDGSVSPDPYSSSSSSSSSLDYLSWNILDSLLLPPLQQPQQLDNNNTVTANDGLFFQYQGLLPKYWYIPINQPPQQRQPQQPQQQQLCNKSEDNHEEQEPLVYINGTKFLHWSLFLPRAAPSSCNNNHSHCHHYKNNNTPSNNNITIIRSSHRLSALPLHASLLWDMIIAVIPPTSSPQDDKSNNDVHHVHDNNNNNNNNNNHNNNYDYEYSYNYQSNKEWWNRVERYYTRIYQYHYYIHTVIMRGCIEHSSARTTKHGGSNNNNERIVPCYNVVHPWESLIDPTSPIWEIVLRPVIKRMQQHNNNSNNNNNTSDGKNSNDTDAGWQLPFDIPSYIQKSYDFPGNPLVYKAMMYLFIEGWSSSEKYNITGICQEGMVENPAICAENMLLFWNTTTNSTNNSDANTTNITNTTTTIPFAMLDVGYASILSQADSDLKQITKLLQMVLPENFYSKGNTRHKLQIQLQQIEKWSETNLYILQKVLWNTKHNTYLSKYYIDHDGENDNDDDDDEDSKMVFVEMAISNNLIPFWNTAAYANDDEANGSKNNNDNNHKNKKPNNNEDAATTSGDSAYSDFHTQNNDIATSTSSSSWSQITRKHWKDLSLQFLRRDKRYAFDCGPFPLWSLGCQESYHDMPSQKSPIIQPIMNYLISNGLLQNEEYLETFGHYIASQSLQLFLYNDNQVKYSPPHHHHRRHHQHHLQDGNHSTNATVYFGDAYNPFYPYQNLANIDDICGNTSTLTAAIVYNFLVPDPTHANRLPIPPIRRGWVITLITVELFMAFSIGVSCLVLSFNLVRKLRYTTIAEEAALTAGAGDDDDDPLLGDHFYPYEDHPGGIEENLAGIGSERGNDKNNDHESISNTPNYDATTTSTTVNLPADRGQAEPEIQSFFGNSGLN